MMTAEEIMNRLAALEQEAVQLRQAAAQAEAAATAARQEAVQAQQVALAANQRAQMSDQILVQLAQLPNDVATAIGNATRANKTTRQLTDPRGLGKPPHFKGDEAEFAMWSRKTENYILSVYSEAVDVLRYAAEHPSPIDLDVMKGDASMPSDEILDEVNAQVYSALMALTTGEPFDIVLGAGTGNGLESWRRLQRRYDPSTVGRSRGLLREILSPNKSNIENLRHNVEKLEEKFRRYCERRDTKGGKLTLNEDIRMASLEALLPDDLEKHIQMNRGRLQSYDALRTEVVLYAEARGTTVKPPRVVQDDPMDTSSLAKGGKGRGKKGDGKGKAKAKTASSGAGPCYLCGKSGHLAKDCWHAAKPDAWRTQSGSSGKASSRTADTECYKCGKRGHIAKDCWAKGDGHGRGGKVGRGKGKGGGKKDANALGECVGDGSEEPDQEVGVFDVASLGTSTSLVDAAGWLRLNLDTGAARSVFPENADYGLKVEEKNVTNFRTATGEIVQSKGGLNLSARDEWGRRMRFPGTLAPVHKPLLAAGQVTDKGNDIWFSGDDAYIIERDSHIQKLMQKTFHEAMLHTGGYGTLHAYKERGVYNLYVRPERPLAGSTAGPGTALDLCPGEPVAAAAGTPSGGCRRGMCL